MASQGDPISNLTPNPVSGWESLLQAPTSSRNGSLERFYDAALVLPLETTAKQLGAAEVERLARQLAVVLVAGSIPRRLGGDAADAELALDRKRSKRVSHVLDQSIKIWTPKPQVELDEEVVRREGAQLDWVEFRAEHNTCILTSLRTTATWAMRHQEIRWGKSAVANLMNEYAWMRYALRD